MMKHNNASSGYAVRRFRNPLPIMAAVVCMQLSAFGVDLDGYHYRYDFSSGAPKFIAGEGVGETPPIASFEGISVTGPDGVDTAFHPEDADNAYVSGLGSILNADWTLAMSVRPGSVEDGVLFSLGRLNRQQLKEVAFCSSADSNKLKVHVLTTSDSSNARRREKVLDLDAGVDKSLGFHTLVAVHHSSSKNTGTLDFYVDGIKQASYTMTTAYPFGDIMQFCRCATDNFSPCTQSDTNPEVAFRDVRLYTRALTSADAREYAALFPPDTLRHSASIRAYGANVVNTGYFAKPTTCYRADFQVTDVVAQERIMGQRGAMGCSLYLNGKSVFAYAMRDNIDKWWNFGIPGDTRRRLAVLDRPNDSATLYYDGNVASATLGGTANNTSAIPTALFADYATGTLEPTDCSKACIYSVEVDEAGAPVHFFAPHYDGTLGACFKDVMTGELHGEANASLGDGHALTFSGGIGSSSDYKYENGYLYAKLYASPSSAAKGSVSVSGGLVQESDGGYWLRRGVSVTLTATPASGYEFLGWVGDTGIIQAPGAVTNASVAVLAERASQLEARFGIGVWTERYDSSRPRFAKRTGDFDVGDYVGSGLLLNLDGIRNAGATAEHNPAAATWTNLGSLGSSADAVLCALAGSIPDGASDGEWTDSGYVFRGKNYFSISSIPELGQQVTMQIGMDYDASSQLPSYSVMFGSQSESVIVYTRQKNEDYCKLNFRVKSASTMISMDGEPKGPYFTALFDSESSRASITEDVFPKWETVSYYSYSIPSDKYSIGTLHGSGSKEGDSYRGPRMAVGTVHSIRIYNRILDEDELEWNRIVDNARFRGEVDANVIVAADKEQLAQAEMNGAYMVNGSHVFSALTTKSEEGTWQAVGYTLELWDPSTRSWTLLEESPSLEYHYTNCAARDKVRLTWKWKLLKGLTIIIW